MRYKLTIRRIGTIFPTICLVVLLFLCIITVWLSIIGLPDFILRKIEKVAAQEGVYLKLHSIKFHPTSGLAFQAKGLQIYASQNDLAPLLSLGTATASVNVSQLILGRFRIDTAQVNDGQADIPVTDTPGATLQVRNLETSARFSRRGNIMLTSGELNIQGIQISITGTCSPEKLQILLSNISNPALPKKEEIEENDSLSPDLTEQKNETGKIDIATLLKEQSEIINTIYHTIEQQQWSDKEAPSITIELKNREHQHVVLKTNVPRLDYGDLHFNDIRLDSELNAEKYCINTFSAHSTDYKADFVAKGGFDKRDSTLSMLIDGRVAILDIARQFSDDPLLRKIDHQDEHRPNIRLKADIRINPDTFSIKRIFVDGKIEQQNLIVGKSLINQLSANFSLRDTQFNISKLDLQLPKSKFDCTANLKIPTVVNGANVQTPVSWSSDFDSSEKEGSATLQAHIDIEEVLNLINEFVSCPIALPDNVDIGKNVWLNAHFDLNILGSQGSNSPWLTYFDAIQKGGITIKDAAINLRIDSLNYEQYQLGAAALAIEITDMRQDSSMRPTAVSDFTLRVSSRNAELLSSNHQPEETLHFDFPMLILDGANFHADWDTFSFSAEKLAVHVTQHQGNLILEQNRNYVIAGSDLTFNLENLLANKESASASLAHLELNLPRVHSLDTQLDALIFTLNLEHPEWRKATGFQLSHATSHMDLEQLKYQELRVEDVEVQLTDLRDLSITYPTLPTCKQDTGLEDSRTNDSLFSQLLVRVGTHKLNLYAKNLMHGDSSIGVLDAGIHAEPGSKGQLWLTLDRQTSTPADHTTPNNIQQKPLALSTDIDWHTPPILTFRNLKGHIETTDFQQLIAQHLWDSGHFKLPECVNVDSGEITINLQGNAPQLKSANIHVSIPELIRTPNTVAANRGEEIPIALEATARLATPEGGQDNQLVFDTAFEISHASGVFRGRGFNTPEAPTRIMITGDSTLSLSTLDSLIDLNDAHEIMRDFHEHHNSKTELSNIKVTLDYANGVAVDSDCLVKLSHIDYMLGVVQVDEHGRETVRTDLGNSPHTTINSCSCRVQAHVRTGMKKEGKSLPEEAVVTIRDAYLNYDNTPWLRKQDFSTLSLGDLGKQAQLPKMSEIRGESIIIDIENSYVQLNKVGGDSVYPAYAFGMFFPDLQHFMKDIILPYPAEVYTDYCLFPIYEDCKQPMSGLISAKVSGSAGYRFLGTTIPIKRFSGFIHLTDDSVYLDRMNSLTWGGVLNAAIKIGISGKQSSFDGFATAENMDLEQIAAAYGSKQNQALTNASIRFRSPTSELKDVQAYGEASISNGDLLGLRLFQPVGDLLSDIPGYLSELEKKALNNDQEKPSAILRLSNLAFQSTSKTINSVSASLDWASQKIPGLNHIIAYDLQDAYASFDILNGHLTTKTLKAKGYNMNVRANLDINLDTMELHGNLWPTISSLPTVILSPLTFLSDFMIDIVVHGKIDDIQWKFALDKKFKDVPPSAVSTPGDPKYKPKKRNNRQTEASR